MSNGLRGARERKVDRQTAVLLIRFALAEAPAILTGMLFWLGAVSRLGEQSLPVRVALMLAVVFSLAGVFFLLRDRWSHLKRSLLERRIVRATAPVVASRDAVQDWISAVPDKSAVTAIEGLGMAAARDWASDGELSSITYYVFAPDGAPRLDIQASAHSSIRSENCNLDFSDAEVRGTLVQSSDVAPGPFRSITQHPYWREAWETAIEASARLVSESNFAYMQVFVFEKDVHFTFLGMSDTRRIQEAFVLDQAGILTNSVTGRVVRRFSD